MCGRFVEADFRGDILELHLAAFCQEFKDPEEAVCDLDRVFFYS
jgi:hypothetical protein